jgi:hypothetical protein
MAWLAWNAQNSWLRRGDAKVAAEYLTRAATGSEPNDTLPAALAAVALRGVGKK